MSVNEDIRDDLVAHDIDLRRLDGAVRNEIDRRYDELGTKLQELLAKHNPHGAVRVGARKRRLRKYEADARKAINEALTDISKIIRKNLRGVARTEATAVIDSIVESI